MPLQPETIEQLKRLPLMGRASGLMGIAHKDQFRKGPIEVAYETHPMQVADKVTDLFPLLPSETLYKLRVVAYIHDTLESDAAHRLTADDLRAVEIPEDVIKAVEVLTRTPEMTYMEHLVPIKDDELARPVKIADNILNLSTTPVVSLVKRYSQSIAFLLS